MAYYGLSDCWSAAEWLKVMGKKGIETLKPEDFKKLREQGVINPEGEIEPDRLTLALMENEHVPQ